MDVLRNISGTRSRLPEIKYKCMSCGEVIENPGPGPYGKRFCSEHCRSVYMKG